MKIVPKRIMYLRRFLFEKKTSTIFHSLLIRLPDNDSIEENHIDIPSPIRYLTSTDETYKPNYYLSIPITESTLIENYVAYRDRLLSKYPTVFTSRSNTTDLPRLHVTLLTLRMENSSQVEQCQISLKRFQEEIRYHCSYPEPIALEFQGIGNFHEKVVYIKCRSNPRLENLRTLIIERFREQQQKQNLNEIFFAGNYADYLPHITLLKCKRKFSSLQSNDKDEDVVFGKQIIDSLQLCSIGSSSNSDDEQKNNCVFKLDLT